VTPALPLLHRDASCVVCAKPSGALVHNTSWAGPRETTALDLARAAFGDDLVPVHRLDRGTSGVLLFARGGDHARAWQEALGRDDADKRYLALVRGALAAPARVDHAFADEDGVRRDAVTDLEPVCAWPSPRCGVVLARPRTGRTHQVRRHLKHLSLPVIGDANYGKGAINRDFAARFGLARLALHAWALTLTHPLTGERVTWCAPLPDDLAGPMARVATAGGTSPAWAEAPARGSSA
jgi:tRNA pseudouridine65 synthase